MKVPINWLKEYVEFDASPEELAEKLTFSGTEVESIKTVGSDYEGIVVGEVLSIGLHPGADRLRVCRVSDGTEELNVVCGAHNFEVGDKAPFARIGARLAGGMKIKKAKIRGEMSQGMLCAEDELGISDNHSDIMLLSRDLTAGTPFSEVMGPPETVLEVEVTWNRPDCLSIIGIARETAALFAGKLKLPQVEFPENGPPVGDLMNVSVEDNDGCPRYTARVLFEVKPGPGPMWMQRRLSLCGVRPINSIVDITNYVMLECGQPLHAFDYNFLSDHRIVVRRARSGEKMTTLDGMERDITPEMLVICDSAKPVALAGVMGAVGSEIGEGTDTVLLESACFSALITRKTSSRLRLTTESSHRFERRVDISMVDWASRRAAALMVEHAGARAASGVIDVYTRKPSARRIKCRFRRVRSLLGIDVPDEEVVSILNSIELPVIESDGGSCTAQVPAFRPDIEIEADLIEEVVRMHGLDRLPAAAPQSKVVPDAKDDAMRAVSICRANLAGLGLSEIINYSFVSKRLLDTFCSDNVESRVILPDPLSSDHTVLRNSLVPQMVESLGKNLARQVMDVSFFEIGNVFIKNDKGDICEEDRVSMGLTGKAGLTGLDKRRPAGPDEVFLWLKGIIEALCAAQRVEALQFVLQENHSFFEAGSAVSVVAGGRQCGVMGLISEPIREKWRMIEPVAVAELALKPLIDRVFEAPEVKPVPVYPSITRDIAVIVDEHVGHEDVLRIIMGKSSKELTSVDLFDIFRGKGIGDNRKSLAYSLVYRSSKMTLTDEAVNEYHRIVKEALKKELKAEIRE